jgi:glycosyltransferase involved in cell wall biosynthesis
MSIHNLRGVSPPWAKLRDGFIDRYLLKKVKSWIFVSQVTLDSIGGSDFGKASSHVVYNGICDLDNAFIGGKVPIPVKKDVYNFGLVGTFENRKGFDLAIRAYSKVKTSGGVGMLKIFGEGSNKETALLYDLIKELDLVNSVEFVGFVKDKSEIYEAVDVIVPSRAFESFGYVALESIQRNVPVIVSDHGGLKEVSEIIGNPNVFISDNVEALEKLLVSVTQNYHQNVNNLQVMRSKIRAQFNQERMVQEYEAIILNNAL